jgi:lipoprotein-anchoring transpeptidase ErfK/SrfK
MGCGDKILPMPITRREFLKLSAAGFLSLALAELRLDEVFALESPVSFQGRTAISGVPLYETPSFKSKQIKLIGKDRVLELQSQLTGEGTYNRIWYHIAEGYVHSAEIQPVHTELQKPVTELKRKQALGEISVPFSDTRHTYNIYAERAYRVYYGSTHWVTDINTNPTDGSVWYRILDNHLEQYFYLAAEHVRFVPDEELSPLSPDVPNALKTIYVDLKSQYIMAFEDDRLVLRTRCASGVGRSKTPTGKFETYHKGPSVHMTNDGEPTKNIYDLPGVPWCSFFTGTGIALHGTYWHNDFGDPRSHGCVNLPNSAAKFLYRWTSPTVPPEADYIHKPKMGTTVHVS